jgi:hypothetical protein
MAYVSEDGSSNSSRAALKKESSNGSCKSVSFALEGEVFYIPSIDEYTETERRMMWFESYEYTQIKANNAILVKMMKTGHYPEDHQYCYRGLEFKTVARYRERRNAKTLASMAIFTEQRRQWEDGENDIEEIRDAYEEVSRLCHERAHKLALKDAVSADIPSSVAQPYPTEPPQEAQVEFRVSSSHGDASSILTEDTDTDIWSNQSDETNLISSANAVAPSLPTCHQSCRRKTQRPQRAGIA